MAPVNRNVHPGLYNPVRQAHNDTRGMSEIARFKEHPDAAGEAE